VADFSGARGCVNMIQLFAASNVGEISACSEGSRPLKCTMTGLSSSAPHVDFAPLRALEKKGGGRETCLANLGFCSENFGGFAKNLP